MRQVSTGVPQGSIVGPLLFNIFINNIIKACSKFAFILYADDTTLNSTLDSFGNDTEEIQNSIISELKKVFKWLDFNKLCLNLSKSKFMLFQVPQKRVPNLLFNIDRMHVNELNSGIITTIHKACADTTGQCNTQSQIQTSKSRSTPWWTNSTQIAKNRKSLWYGIWSSCDKPRDGYVYVCYKLAKTKYRQACRLAFNERIRSSFHRLNFLYTINNSKKFWNTVRKCRRATNDPSSDIALSSLVKYYSEKFSMNTAKSNTILAAEQFVYERQQELLHVKHNAGFTVPMVSKYIQKLKRNSAPAADGITAEHLIYSADSDIVRHITKMLTLCVQFGVVPDNFTNGLLIPIPKKAGCDTSVPKNWRPIVISTTLSKILEMYVLEESNTHEFHDLQFGFIPGRGTEIATALLNDVTTYCNTRGSAVYTCSLDAEGAFDAIPHSILFYKAAAVLPKHCWHVMHTWYSKLLCKLSGVGLLAVQ